MKQLRQKGHGEDEVMQYSYIEEQMMGNSYEAVEKGNGKGEVMQYSCIGEHMKGNSYEAVERRDMVKMKLCSTLIQRNR